MKTEDITQSVATQSSITEGLTLKNLTDVMEKGLAACGNTAGAIPDLYLIRKGRLRGKRNHYLYREIMRGLKSNRIFKINNHELTEFPPWMVAFRPNQIFLEPLPTPGGASLMADEGC